MNSVELVLQLIALFDRLTIRYMLVGSFSSNFYGRPRSTKDADFVVVLADKQLTQLQQGLGAEFHLDPQMSFETVTMTMRHIITHPATAFKIELFLLTDDPHDRARFERRLEVELEGHHAWMPTPEDVVIQKLRWSRGGRRSKDIIDASHVLSVQKDHLDLAYIRGWTDQHETRELFEKLLTQAALPS